MEDFVSFEIAKKLKETGFDCKYPFAIYFGNRMYYDYGDLIDDKDAIIAPTISQVLKWLREEKRLHIAIDIWNRTWGYDIIELTSGNSLHWTAYREDIKSYEDAALDGIKYVLDKLI